MLQDSQRIAQETKAKQEAAATTEEHIHQARLLYEPLANYSSMLFFTVHLLARLHPMYHFSLAWYQTLFKKALD